jgi:uncharacterized protein YndB with AHSA1/START domain
MASTDRLIHAPPARVFEVLADPRSYAYWVIGSREVRAADADWPQPASRFHHTVNIGPLHVRDHTEVEKMEPDRFLQLKANARPFGTARVKLDLEPEGDGTRVTMIEQAGDTLSAFLFQPLTHLLLRRRNDHSLERLAELAEGSRPMPGEEPEARVRWPGDGGPVVNPTLHEQSTPTAAVARGAAAALAVTAAGVALARRAADR